MLLLRVFAAVAVAGSECLLSLLGPNQLVWRRTGSARQSGSLQIRSSELRCQIVGRQAESCLIDPSLVDEWAIASAGRVVERPWLWRVEQRGRMSVRIIWRGYRYGVSTAVN